MSNVTRRDALAIAGTSLATLAASGCSAAETPTEGQGSLEVNVVEPLDESETSGWDTDYYAPVRTTSSLEEAAAASREVALQIQREGTTLLTNDGTLPLAAGTQVTLLGRGAADTVFGGTGAAGFSADKCQSLREGLAEAGLTVSDTAYDWIQEHAGDRPRAEVGHLDWPWTVTHYIGEIPWSDYPQEVRDTLSGTVGIVVVSRQSHEGADLSDDLLRDLADEEQEAFVQNDETASYVEGQHELELTQEERDLIQAAREACEKVVVLLNVATTFEVGPLVPGGELEVSAILSLGLPGQVGARAVGDILAGATNPSGRTCDVWPYDLMSHPSCASIANNTYTDVTDYYENIGSGAHFVEYGEGIYVGYRYYETADAMGAIDYDATVAFPFGYGLSYTTFESTLDEVMLEPTEDTGELLTSNVSATVTVTNTGEVPGREVVQLYFSAPWTSECEVEKPACCLVAFAKTDELAPGESQTLLLEWPLRNMASYDQRDHRQAWVVEMGTYEITLRADSHNVVATAFLDIESDVVFSQDDNSNNAVMNRFGDVTAYMEDHVTRLSRQDMAGTLPPKAEDKTAASVGLSLQEYDPLSAVDADDEMPTLHAKNGLSLIDLRGLDYDDPLWEKLLDQLLVVHMTDCLANSVGGTPEVPAVGKPAVVEYDGPAGFTPDGHCAFPCEYVLASTWNVELARQLGAAIGEEALQAGINGWAAPATNMHRSPFGGRNFEYYSEDPLLAGSMAVATVSAVADYGVYAEVKHFLLNDQDTNRCAHLLTWADEQTIREIYARPFEMVVKQAKATHRYLDGDGFVQEVTVPACTAIMSSYNYIGDVWAGGLESLQTGLLRDEWGYAGHVISDWSFYDYMEKNQAIYAGTDVNFTSEVETGDIVDDESATAILAMRQAMHRYLHTLANSNAMAGQAPTVRVSYEL